MSAGLCLSTASWEEPHIYTGVRDKLFICLFTSRKVQRHNSQRFSVQSSSQLRSVTIDIFLCINYVETLTGFVLHAAQVYIWFRNQWRIETNHGCVCRAGVAAAAASHDQSYMRGPRGRKLILYQFEDWKRLGDLSVEKPSRSDNTPLHCVYYERQIYNF